jgi:nicotinamide mononucleotide adenylyltransferase
MATGEKWKSLVPAPVAKIIREINGVERVKAIAERGHH